MIPLIPVQSQTTPSQPSQDHPTQSQTPARNITIGKVKKKPLDNSQRKRREDKGNEGHPYHKQIKSSRQAPGTVAAINIKSNSLAALSTAAVAAAAAAAVHPTASVSQTPY